jgi:hypothetical protein
MKGVIWLNGMPRSGTSWLSQIFDSHPQVSFKLSPLFSYEFKNFVNEHSTKSDWEELFQNVFDSKDEFINQSHRRLSGEYPKFVKNNLSRLVIKDTRYHNLTESLLYLFEDIKIIHIIRNPCGAINSWLRAPKEFSVELNYIDEWRTGKSRKTGKEEFWGFNDWLFLTKKYLKLEEKFPENVKVIFYEELVECPYSIVKMIFDFVNLIWDTQTNKFILESQSSHNDSEYAVFKNKVVAYNWRHQLDPIIINEIKTDLINNNLDKYFKI